MNGLKGVADKGKGFLDFAVTVQQRNNFCKEEILEAIEQTEQQMIQNGIVGVGDICNTSDTLNQKQKLNLEYYNFIEVFGVNNSKSVEIISVAKTLRDKFRKNGMSATISPHAPFSVPPILMKEIGGSFDSNDKIITIHNQETEEENELFENKSGAFFSWLNNINASSDIWEKRNSSSEQIDLKIETNSSRRVLAKNSKGFATNYELKVISNFTLTFENQLHTFNIVEKLPEINTEILLITGAEDKATPIAEAKAIAESCSNSKLFVIKNASHLAIIEQPDLFDTAIVNFINKAPLPA